MFDLVYLQSWAIGLIPWLVGFLVLLILDIATGIVVAVYDGVFEWEKTTEGFRKGAAYLWMWVVVECLAMLPIVLQVDIPDYAPALANFAPKAIFSVIVVGKYVTSILKNVAKFIGLQKTNAAYTERLHSVGDPDDKIR